MKRKFKAATKYMIHKDPADKKTHFIILRNYYTDYSELKRVKKNKGNCKYENLLFMNQTQEEYT